MFRVLVATATIASAVSIDKSNESTGRVSKEIKEFKENLSKHCMRHVTQDDGEIIFKAITRNRDVKAVYINEEEIASTAKVIG